MSGRYSYYLGPYVETRCAMVPVDHSLAMCSNVACDGRKKNRYLAAKFCGACGAERSLIIYQQPGEAVSPEQVSIDEMLTDWRIEDGLRAWTPNRPGASPEPRRFHVDPVSSAGVVPIGGGDVGLETDWLISAFAPEIAALMTAYGADNVRVRWGLVWMWM